MYLLMGWLLAVLSIAGHTEWWIMAVNRSHALHIRATKLRKFRTLHDIAVLGYPFVLLWLLGFGPTSILRGGVFSDLTETLQWLLIATIAGCIPLVLGIVRWQLIRHPQFHSADKRERHDVLKTSLTESTRNNVKGPRRHVSHMWPWNEIFHLEVNTKSVRLSRAAANSHNKRPLRLVHFSDLHFIGCPGEDYYRFVVAQALSIEADVYVFTGDLIDNMELLNGAVNILQPLTKKAPCYFILGNHDWKYDFEHIRTTLSESGWKCVTGQYDIVRLGSHRVLVAGTEKPWMGEAPPQVRDAGCDLRILLSHSPDQIRFAQRCGYDLMLSGHTHGGQVVLPLVGPVYSPSLYGVNYVSGLFPMGDLTLHVSRGIGAKDPMRWRCSPELTCLEIYC